MRPIFAAAMVLTIALVVVGNVPPALAQAGSSDQPVEISSGLDVMRDVVHPLVLSVVFTLVGILLFAICIWLIVMMSPFSVRKEIEEDQNTALGIIIGAMILGIAIILAAAIMG